MMTRLYRVRGVVQGVGFRPFIHRLARTGDIRGWVLNDSAGVLICAQGGANAHQVFAHAIVHQAPPAAVVASIEATDLAEAETFAGFSIRASVSNGSGDTLIPPDLSVCHECRAELLDPADRRYRYPFINCTNCGPRYSIIGDMPYDRPMTTMAAFAMCPACAHEYHDIESRRYHAQPNACPVCGPSLTAHRPDGTPIETAAPLDLALRALREGRIVAIKSLGGFHLAVNARDEAAVRELRRRKRRDSKPFALMVRDTAMVARLAWPSELEIKLLASTERPITLVRKRHGVLPEVIAPRAPSFGIMLPSAPLHELLFGDDLDVLVMTSGNISRHPIEFTNDGAFDKLGDIVDLFLVNNRDIRIRIDDSIVACTTHPGLPKPIVTFIRRARGYAPYPVLLPAAVAPVLAYGAELKSTIAQGRGGEVFLSQHIGDLTNSTTQASHTAVAAHLTQLLKVTPTALACDMHPLFHSSDKAVRNARLPVIRVQHHHAHMAACMAENGAPDATTVGIILDGTGYGTDGTIWGGEFLVGDYRTVTRQAHLRRFRLLGGDAAVKEPFRVAVALLRDAFGDGWKDLRLPFADRLADGRGALLDRMAGTGVNSPITTSMGRLFDGVAALLGVCAVIEYEAQAAIELEALLDRDLSLATPLPYDLEERDGVIEIDHRSLVRELAALRAADGNAAALSRRFHTTIVDIVGAVAERLARRAGTRTVALSGGVFMNEYILANAIVDLQARGLTPLWHSKVPPNDGGLSLGQVVVADAQLRAVESDRAGSWQEPATHVTRDTPTPVAAMSTVMGHAMLPTG